MKKNYETVVAVIINYSDFLYAGIRRPVHMGPAFQPAQIDSRTLYTEKHPAAGSNFKFSESVICYERKKGMKSGFHAALSFF